MVRSAMSAILVLTLAAGGALAGGSKIKYARCGSEKDFEKVLAESKYAGRPVMVLFSSDMCPACQGFDKDALSQESVIKATEGFTCVKADPCGQEGLMKRYDVRNIPDVVFLSPAGEKVGKLADRSAKGFEKQLAEVAAKHARSPKWAADRAAALADATERKAPALLFVADESPASALAERSFGELPLADLLGKVAWAKEKMSVKDAKALGLTRLPALLVLDPAKEDPAAAPVKKFALPVETNALKMQLSALLKTWGEQTPSGK